MKQKKIFILFFIISFIGITNHVLSQTTVTIRPNASTGKDAYVRDLTSTSNYGTSNEFTICAWTFSGNPVTVRSLLDFDFSFIPAGSTITSANLYLYNYPASQTSNGQHSQQSGSNAMLVQRITSAWSEQTVTWSNQPSVTTQNQVSVPASSSPTQNYTIDVTSLTQDIVNNPSSSFGFMFKLQTEQYYRSVILASSDVADTTLHPKIVITYIVNNDSCITMRPDASTGKDAYVRDLTPTSNYGTSNEFTICAWTFSGNPVTVRSLLDFDFSSIPAGSTITSANLYLYNYPASQTSNGQHSQQSGSNAMLVQRITSSWNEQTVTWNNQPSVTTQNQVSVPASSSPTQNYTIDVTSLTQDIVNNPSSGFGFMFKLQTEQYYRSVIFASSDVVDTTLHPKIVICYQNLNSLTENKNNINSSIIFPNPASEFITLSTDINNKSDLTLNIYNLMGNLVKSEILKQDQQQINIEDLSSGIYIVEVSSSDLTRKQKLVIQK